MNFATQVARFLASGGAATLVHWAVLGLLARQGLMPVPASIIGAAVGSIANYFLQFYWAFFTDRRSHGRAIPLYACTVLLGWCINAAVLYMLISISHAELPLAQASTSAVVAAWNFFIYKRVVFHERIN